MTATIPVAYEPSLEHSEHNEGQLRRDLIGPIREADRDGLSFSPWHGFAAHQPLGSINRARMENHESSNEFRAEHNGCPFREPKGERAA
jgi:hypothetical protein